MFAKFIWYYHFTLHLQLVKLPFYIMHLILQLCWYVGIILANNCSICSWLMHNQPLYKFTFAFSSFQRKHEDAIPHRVRGPSHHSLDMVHSLNSPKVIVLFSPCVTYLLPSWSSNALIELRYVWHLMFYLSRKRRIQSYFLHSGNVCTTCR